MSDYHAHQAGFGVMLALVILVAIAAIGGAGFLVYERNVQTEALSPTVSPNTASAPIAKPVTTKQPPANASLVIDEWGVTLSLPESLKDAYYVPSTGSADPDGSVNTIWLGLKSKDTATCGAALGNTGGSTLGAIVRTLPTDVEPVRGKLYSEVYTGATVGKYFYGYGASVESNNKCGPVASRTDINAAFGAATQNVKPE